MKNLLLWMIMVTSLSTQAATLECEYNFGKTLSITTEEKTYFAQQPKMRVKIVDTHNPSEVNDYVQLFNDEYEITYALACTKASK